MKELIAGGIAGFVATAPMTVAMEIMHRQLPPGQRYPLPPREIIDKIAEEADLDSTMDEQDHQQATMAAHFGYGTACGLAYGMVSPHLPGPPLVRGISFGLIVWTGSYLGLLPALKILKPATDHPAKRNALMITAHLVWGAATGLIADALVDDE